MHTAPAKDNRGSDGCIVDDSAHWEDNFFTPGQLILNSVNDDIQMAGFVNEIQIIGANGKHWTNIKSLQPLRVERVE